MKIAVIGTGYVGLTSAVCFAHVGHDVICMDIDEEKIEKLNRGQATFYESGIPQLLNEGISREKLSFTSSLPSAINRSDIIFICVPTPTDSTGKADLSFLEKALIDSARNTYEHKIFVIKSTVPISYHKRMKEILDDELHRCKSIAYDLVYNPEFLKEGTAVTDMMKPDRIVIGCDNPKVFDKMMALYLSWKNVPMIFTNFKSAGLIKYASNCFLATKISFINFIARICDASGANIYDVAKGMGLDDRIGKEFLRAGVGFGGSCFGKDVKACYQFAKDEYGLDFRLLQETLAINDTQIDYFYQKIAEVFPLRDKACFSIWGLSFKPGTDDLRDSPSIKLIEKLLIHGYKVLLHDPEAVENAKQYFKTKELDNQVCFRSDFLGMLNDSDALILMTDWPLYKNTALATINKNLRIPVIFDGRNCYDKDSAKQLGIEYYGVGA